MYRWKCSQDGKPCRQKSRVVMQGFHEADIGTDKAAPVASQESVHLLIANAANTSLILRQVDIKTAFLQARMERDDPDVYVNPLKGFECEEKQKDQVWRPKAWLYGLRLSPHGWWGTMHSYLSPAPLIRESTTWTTGHFGFSMSTTFFFPNQTRKFCRLSRS